MRSSVPCSSWIDSFSLLDIQVVSLKRDYYVSLACQVDFVRDNPSQVLALRGLRNHTTIEISLSHIHMVSGLVPGTYVDDKGSSEIVMSCRGVGFRKLAFPFPAGNIRANALNEPKYGPGAFRMVCRQPFHNRDLLEEVPVTGE